MFRKRKPEPQARQAAKPTVKLTAAEKREISRILETARGNGRVHSAQDTLPFRQMYPDGLCKLDDHTWSKCIEFEDVNYQLAKPDDQTAIFEALCDMYNAHDASIGMQLSLVSRRMNREDFVKRIEIAAQGDHFDHIRELYTQMLRKQLERGNNGLIKTKYLTLTIEARDSKTARARFSRIVMDALNHFKVMGALAKELGGKEWLKMLHGILHPDGERFAFEWSWLAPSGLSVQDFIAPSSFRFGEARKFTMADKSCAVSFLQISAPEMDDRMVNADSVQLFAMLKKMQDSISSIETTKKSVKMKYEQLGAGWQDKKYNELGVVVRDCNKALNDILVIMLQAEKYVALLAKSLSEYESVQLGSTNGISASTPQTSSFAVTPSSADTTTFESNTFGSNLAFVQDRLSAERYFSRGNHYEEYRDYWENGNYTFSRNENPELVYVRARDIEGVYLSDRELGNPEGFWTRNGREGWSRENILRRASHIQDVRQNTESGMSLDELSQNPVLDDTIRSYYNNPVQVAQVGSYYVFQSDGRHRTLAAQSLDTYIPVLVTGSYTRND